MSPHPSPELSHHGVCYRDIGCASQWTQQKYSGLSEVQWTQQLLTGSHMIVQLYNSVPYILSTYPLHRPAIDTIILICEGDLCLCSERDKPVAERLALVSCRNVESCRIGEDRVEWWRGRVDRDDLGNGDLLAALVWLPIPDVPPNRKHRERPDVGIWILRGEDLSSQLSYSPAGLLLGCASILHRDAQ